MTINELIEKLELIRTEVDGNQIIDFFQIDGNDKQHTLDFYSLELFETYAPVLKFRKFE